MRKKFMYILNLIQLIVFTLILIINLGFLTSYREAYKKSTELLEVNKNIIYRGQPIEGEESEVGCEKLDKLYKYALSLKDKGFVKNAYRNVTGGGAIDVEGMGYIDFATYSKEFNDVYPIEVCEGRSFNTLDLEGEKGSLIIPVITGYDLKDSFKVGDTFKAAIPLNMKGEGDYIVFEDGEERIYQLDPTYKVIGIAKPNSMAYLGQLIPYTSSYRNDVIYAGNFYDYTKVVKNNEIVFEAFGERIEKELYNGQSEIIVECLSEDDAESIQSLLQDKAEEIGLAGSFEIIDEETVNNNEYRNLYLTSLVLTIVLIFFSLTGLISLIRYTMEQRRKEFGIYLATGATKGYIALLNIRYVASLIALALLFGGVVSKGLKGIVERNLQIEDIDFLSNLFVFNKELVTFMALLYGVVFIMSLIPILNKVRKYSVVELIRGK